MRSSPPPQQPTPTAAQMAPPEPARRGRSRRAVTGRFKGFDEEFTGAMLGSVPEAMAVDSAPAVESQSQGLFVSQDPHRMDVGRDGSQLADTQRGSRKRSTPPMDYEESQDIMDDVAPAAQAFKKRKLAEEAARRRRGESTPPPAVQVKATGKLRALKKEIDVQEVLARKQAEDVEKAAKAEELARTEREALQETLDGMTIDDIRNLAIIEEMPVMRRAPPPCVAAQADESDRWDERWNGRKNFKKFRRRGADPNDRRVTGRVLVQLEEVKKKDFGIGDEYWLEGGADTTSQRKKKKPKGKDTEDIQTQSQARSHPQPKTRGRGAAARAAEILASEVEEEYALPDDVEDTRVPASSDVEIVEPSKRQAARSQAGNKLVDKTNETQNLQTQRGSKRAAATVLSKRAPAKKVKPAPVQVEVSDDDSDDGLKFRFARRK
jgi:nijmegen breakage syndrome protein 1